MSGSRAERRQLWLERMQRFTSSGLKVAEFCQSESVSIPSFYQWRKKLSPTAAPDAGAQKFLAVRLASSDPLEIHLPNGARICVPGNDLSLSLIDMVIAAVGRVPSASQVEETRCV